jgi:hypothetical protein
VSEKSLEVRSFQVLTHPEEPQLTLLGLLESLGLKTNEKNSSNGGGWIYNPWWLGGQTKILLSREDANGLNTLSLD